MQWNKIKLLSAITMMTGILLVETWTVFALLIIIVSLFAHLASYAMGGQERDDALLTKALRKV